MNIRPILIALVALLALIGGSFGIDWLLNGACTVDSVLQLGVDECVSTTN